MKPYYQDEKAGITIYHGDCREILPALPKVDLVLTDPPYDERTHEGAATETVWQSPGIPKDEIPNAIDFAPCEPPEIVNLALSVCDKWCIAFCSLEHLGSYKEEAWKTASWVRAGIWDRVQNTPQLSGDRPAQGGEGIAIWHKRGRKKWNGGGKAAIWRCGVEYGRKQHPTQKPLILIKIIASQFSNEGDTIIDPFIGSGTTLRAAKDLGRKAIGIEIEERYCEIAARRLSQEVFSFT